MKAAMAIASSPPSGSLASVDPLALVIVVDVIG
jgi:hypothetical protein